MENKLDIPQEGVWPTIFNLYPKSMAHRLNYYLEYFEKYAQNINNPYHNLRHTLHVFWVSNLLSQYYTFTEITMEERYIVSVASIFHDWNHAGESKVPDEINIQNANKALDKCLTHEDHKYFFQIKKLIENTKVPSKVMFKDLGLIHQILIEADRSQVLASDWKNQTLGGFSREWQISPRAILERQEAFMLDPQGMPVLSRGAKMIFPELRSKRIDETNMLLGLKTELA